MEELSVTEFDREIGELELPKLTLLRPDDSVSEAIKYFADHPHSLIGIEEDGKLAGIVTEWDLVHQFSPNIDPKDVKLSELLVERPVTLYSENTLYEVMNVMGRRNFPSFPVCGDDGKATHYFNTQVLFNYLVSYFPKILKEMGTLEVWEPTKIIQAFSEGFSYSSTMEDDSSLHQNYFLTPFDRIPSATVLKADAKISLGEAWQMMLDAQTENLVLTEHGTKLVGILTVRDLITKVLVNEGGTELSRPIKDFMTPEPHSLMYKHAIGYGINHFMKYNYKHMIIVDEDRIPLKVVSLLEIFSHLIAKIKLN